jgi:hypothetical protein
VTRWEGRGQLQHDDWEYGRSLQVGQADPQQGPLGEHGTHVRTISDTTQIG